MDTRTNGSKRSLAALASGAALGELLGASYALTNVLTLEQEAQLSPRDRAMRRVN